MKCNVVRVFAEEQIIEEYVGIGIPSVPSTPLELFPIFTEYGRTGPEPKVKPDNLAGLTILNSKKFDFIMDTNLLAEHLLGIHIYEARAVGGVQVLRRSLFPTTENVEFTHRAINDVVFIEIISLSTAPGSVSGDIKIVSRIF